MPNYKLQPVSLPQVKTELKNHICNRFYGISYEDSVSMERVLKNADNSVLSNFLAIFFEFFPISRNFKPGLFRVKSQIIENLKSDLSDCKAEIDFYIKQLPHVHQLIKIEEESLKSMNHYDGVSFILLL